MRDTQAETELKRQLRELRDQYTHERDAHDVDGRALLRATRELRAIQDDNNHLRECMANNVLSEDTVRLILFLLANSMGYTNASELVDNFLDGMDVTPKIGSHGVYRLNAMLEVIRPKPRT